MQVKRQIEIEELKQYRSVCVEIKDLEDELKGKYVGDAVTSASRFPYGKRTMHIEGCKSDGGTVAMLARLSELKSIKSEIEGFVRGVKDREIKLILSWRYISGRKAPSWQAIAMRLGYQAEHTPKRKLQKYFNKSEKSDFKC